MSFGLKTNLIYWRFAGLRYVYVTPHHYNIYTLAEHLRNEKVYLSMAAAEQLLWMIWNDGSPEAISKPKKQKLSTCSPPFLSFCLQPHPLPTYPTTPTFDNNSKPTNIQLSFFKKMQAMCDIARDRVGKLLPS